MISSAIKVLAGLGAVAGLLGVLLVWAALTVHRDGLK